MDTQARVRCQTSPFNVFAQSRQGMLVFNCFTGALALLDNSEVKSLAADEPLDQALQSLLVNEGFFEPAPNSQLEEIRRSYRAWLQTDSTLFLTLAPTLACNFACTYCFQRNLAPQQAMSQATQDELVQFVNSLLPGKRGLSVVWYGGEPLLAWQTVKRLTAEFIHICQKLDIEYKAAMVTNGYLLTEDKVSELPGLRIQRVQVTLDGPASVHDARRLPRRGGSSFGQIVANLAILKQVQSIEVNIRVNIDKETAGCVRELLTFLADRGFAHRDNVKVSFAPVKNGMGSGEPSCLVDDAFSLWQARLYREAQEFGITGDWMPRPRRGSCGAVHPSSYVVGPTGATYKCWEAVGHLEMAVGHVSDHRRLEQSRWLNFDPFWPSCAECSVLPLCLGGCPLPRIVSPNQPPDESWCHLVRSSLELWMLSTTTKIVEVTT